MDTYGYEARHALADRTRRAIVARLVVERAAGARRIYRLDPAGVAALRDELDTFESRVPSGYEDARRTTTRGAGMNRIEGWPLYLDRYADVVAEGS